MLALDAEQWRAFAQASFIARMQEVLTAFSGGTPAATPDAIAAQLQLAREHGFTSERDCACWVLCAWCLGAEFHRKISTVVQLLQRQDVGAEFKAMTMELSLHAVFIALAGRSRLLP